RGPCKQKKEPAFSRKRVGLQFVPHWALARSPLGLVTQMRFVFAGTRAQGPPRTDQPRSFGPRAPPHASMHESTAAPPLQKGGPGFAAGSELLIGSLRGIARLRRPGMETCHQRTY